MLISRKNHERLIAELKEAHAREREILVDQIDYLRAQQGWIRASQQLSEPEYGDRPPALHVSDLEEDLQHMAKTERATQEEIEAELARLQFANTIVTNAE